MLSNRCEELGEYMLKNCSTVRKTASYYGISKSTVHKDVTKKLKIQNPALAEKVALLLKYNKEERHIRGGEATKQKYKKQSKISH